MDNQRSLAWVSNKEYVYMVIMYIKRIERDQMAILMG